MNIIKFKKWSRNVFVAILAVLIVASAINVTIDPFFQYHKPLENLCYDYDDVLYQGAGMIKNHDYEGLIIGSSLIQNMRPSYSEELFNFQTIKVPLCGMSFDNIQKALTLAVKKNSELKKVIMNIDSTVILNEEAEDDFPDYLYDNNLFNDVDYVLNKSILIKKNINIILNSIKGKKTETLDTAFSSEKQFYFSEYSAIQSYEDCKNVPISFDVYETENTFNENINCLADIVSKNSSVQFDLFIAPYSILKLKTMSLNSYLDLYIALIEKAYERLSQYSNCNFYYFQDDEDIICNLYNYCDLIHFSKNISDKILLDISKGNNLLTDQNYKTKIENTKTIVKDFDYSVFDSNTIKIKQCTNIKEYNEILENPKYSYAISVVDSTSKNSDDNINNIFVKNRNNIDFNFSDNGMISIDNVTYSYGLDGINYVVYDNELGRIIDSVRFDPQTGKAYNRISDRRK